jgi:hypothetical protein
MYNLGSISFIISEKILKQKNTTKLVRGPWAQVDLETLTSENPYGPMLNISCHTGHLDFSSIQTKYTFI